MRLETTIVCALAFVLLTGCKKPKRGHIPIAQVQPRAAKFEPIMAAIKKLPANPPPVTKTSVPADAFIGTGSTPGTTPTPEEYLVIHTEDLVPPRYYSDAGVKVRLANTGVLSACATGLAEVKAAKEPTVHEYTLLPCTNFKYAFLVRTTEYLQPKTRTASDTTAGNKRTIVENVIPGHLKADVTVYSLPDGKAVGGFQLKAVSSALPSTEGGMDGAVDRDLVKQANAALIEACSAAGRGAGGATAPAPKTK